MRSVDRFPQNGGRVVIPDKLYILKVAGKDKNGDKISDLGGTYTFGEQAIVNFDVEL